MAYSLGLATKGFLGCGGSQLSVATNGFLCFQETQPELPTDGGSSSGVLARRRAIQQKLILDKKLRIDDQDMQDLITLIIASGVLE